MQKGIVSSLIISAIGIGIYLSLKPDPMPQVHSLSAAHTLTSITATGPALVGLQAPQAITVPPTQGSKLDALYNGQIKDFDTATLKALKAELTAQKMQTLALWSTDTELSSQTRQASLYVLTEMGEAAIPALTVIASMPMKAVPSKDPHSLLTAKYSEDVGIRITAIEALDKNTQRPELILPAMQMVLNSQSKEQSLILLAQISISGIQSGNPGKVQRAIEAMLKGKE